MMLKTYAASLCIAALTQTPVPTSTSAFDDGGVIYEATHDLDYVPTASVRGDVTTANVGGEHLKLSRGDALILEDVKTDAHGETLVRFSFDETDQNLPTTYWIRRRDLNNVDLKLTVRYGEQLFTPVPKLTNPTDEDFVRTREARRFGYGHARPRRGANFCMTHPLHPRCCKSAVNYFLLARGLIQTRVAGEPARDMAKGLKEQNWHEVGCPARARPTFGMTCTYRGGRSGHTEAFNGRCWYYGAKCSRTPMDQPNRQCFSCKVPDRRR